MPPELVALIDKPHLLIVVLAIGAVAGMVAERLAAQLSRNARRQKWRSRNEQKPYRTIVESAPGKASFGQRPLALLDAAEQLRIVMGADFITQPLLNKSEARVFKELGRAVSTCNPAWQVMAQVSLGEILRSKDASAYSCINSKRVDLLLMDDACQPRHAIEYQGVGHHQGSAAARDAVKREALRRAGIGYHEVVAGQTTPTELRRLVEKLVEKPTP